MNNLNDTQEKLDYYTGSEVFSTGLDTEIEKNKDKIAQIYKKFFETKNEKIKLSKTEKVINFLEKTPLIKAIEENKSIYSKGKLNLEDSIGSIYDYLKSRNPEKYEGFLRKMKKMNFILHLLGVNNIEERIKLYEYTYFSMRLLDDIVDGDIFKNKAIVSKENGFEKLSLEDRKSISDNSLNLKDKTKSLYNLMINEIDKIGMKLGLENEINTFILQIIKSLNFDIIRIIDDNKIRNKDDLRKNFDLMDIEGTIIGSSIIMGIDRDNIIEKLRDLGICSRTCLTLYDLPDDIKKDLINISKEDIDKYNINQDDFDYVKSLEYETLVEDRSYDSLPNSIKEWVRDQSDLAKKDFKIYKNKIKLLNLFSSEVKWEGKGNKRNIFNNIILKYIVIPNLYYDDIKIIINNDKFK